MFCKWAAEGVNKIFYDTRGLMYTLGKVGQTVGCNLPKI